MQEITTFFEMGGYAAYVWSSLGLTAVIMAGLFVATLRQLRHRQRRLAELEAQGAQRRRRSAQGEALREAGPEAGEMAS